MEELQARHRKEQRDLQSRITQKKKQASKKTRKGVNDECDRLEADLKEKQAGEVAALNGEDTAVTVEALDDLTLDTTQTTETAVADETASSATAEAGDAGTGVSEPNGEAQGPKKGNRQKARLARRAAEQEEAARKAAEEAKNLPDLKEQERSRMLEAMKARDQLDHLRIPLGATPGDMPDVAGYKLVRSAAAEYIEKNSDDFVPFLEEPLPDYLHKIRDTGEWGGQLELLALAKTYGTVINVLQDFGRVEKIEGGSGEKAIWLGYYKHGFGLGEHYNSLRKAG
ncbi:OTU protein [Saxophila tyrrhenica]|uniref:OTU protein n=1 Tax=Saxophila tyrrhenica TaxID=1690608 RepID=A0AAV9NYE4_9PEZI|nr:OTU protein [Saxophila tyrrhenica]